jgi:hypothetical protein
MFMDVYVGYGSRTGCPEEEPSAAAPFEMYIHSTMKDIGKREICRAKEISLQ